MSPIAFIPSQNRLDLQLLVDVTNAGCVLIKSPLSYKHCRRPNVDLNVLSY